MNPTDTPNEPTTPATDAPATPDTATPEAPTTSNDTPATGTDPVEQPAPGTAPTDTPTQLTFGERAVGLSFNPSSIEEVNVIKKSYASSIDVLNELRSTSDDAEVKRMLSLAITATQEAQMWAVKAVTWNA